MLGLMYSVKEKHRERAVWLLSENAYAHLRKIKYFNGRYAWKSSPMDEEPERLFNCPVYTTKWLGDVAPGSTVALFGDFGYYWIGDRGNRTIKRLSEVRANRGQVEFISSERVDAKLMIPEAIKALKVKG